MRNSRFGQGVALASVLGLCLAATAQAQDEGVKRVEQLTRKARSMVDAIANAKLQLLKTMDVYNTLMSEAAADRKGAYKKLQQEIATTTERRATIVTRASDVDLEAEALFKGWSDSLAAIGDPALRQRSEQRLATTKAHLAEIRNVGQKAAEVYGPVMKTLDDQVTYLGHDLNAAAVASLKPDAAKLNTEVQELGKRIDETITTANEAIAALEPQ